jgi:transketolase
MFSVSLEQTSLTESQLQTLKAMWLRCVRRIIVSTTLAGSGHPGGSMSSLHLLLMLYSTLKQRPQEPSWEGRDRLLVSMGHISPGVYGVLTEFGYVKEEDVFLEFRQFGSAFAGHVEHCVPGVEWNTGNLGQGLSAGTGMALALKLAKHPARVAVIKGCLRSRSNTSSITCSARSQSFADRWRHRPGDAAKDQRRLLRRAVECVADRRRA